ncbi:flagellar hook-associated protein FlgL [Shewanella sp. NIFS-20-20]|uniref:flagellar hook-associated protein FlgL n=1 Tax=Shewanella sp. NIFS-20-20 TaxID=2853806 RepID=UPI001C46165C|nr:flagellar hook-associated protein FlgL [Shewanella sp. NIFS-20-20]MBV7314781.1 flagellar hook-associated protein FlgL [Shewanella sp. NIFS-20-20]
MRISTSQFYQQNLNSVLQKQSSTAALLDKLGTGKKVNTAGDDPVAAIGIDNLKQQNALVDQFLKNIDYATQRLSLTETKLGNSETVAMNMREQMLRAVNGTLTLGERQTLADELRAGLDELISIANSKDESGNHIFGGFQTDTPPFALDNNGNAVYSGDDGERQTIVAKDRSLSANISGDKAFMNAANPLGDYSVNYSTQLAGDPRIDQANISNPATYVADDYTFNFIANGANVNLEVRDSANGLVTTVTNFDSTSPVSFNGIEVTLSGTPKAGDSLTISPQSQVSLLDTFNQALGLLATDSVNTPAGQAELAQLLRNTDSGLAQLSVARGEAGNSLKQLDSYRSQHQDEILVNTSALSVLEDLDYASAFSEFTQQQVALDAVSNVFGRVGSVSLFDFI